MPRFNNRISKMGNERKGTYTVLLFSCVVLLVTATLPILASEQLMRRLLRDFSRILLRGTESNAVNERGHFPVARMSTVARSDSPDMTGNQEHYNALFAQPESHRGNQGSGRSSPRPVSRLSAFFDNIFGRHGGGSSGRSPHVDRASAVDHRVEVPSRRREALMPERVTPEARGHRARFHPPARRPVSSIIENPLKGAFPGNSHPQLVIGALRADASRRRSGLNSSPTAGAPDSLREAEVISSESASGKHDRVSPSNTGSLSDSGGLAPSALPASLKGAPVSAPVKIELNSGFLDKVRNASLEANTAFVAPRRQHQQGSRASGNRKRLSLPNIPLHRLSTHFPVFADPEGNDRFRGLVDIGDTGEVEETSRESGDSRKK